MINLFSINLTLYGPVDGGGLESIPTPLRIFARYSKNLQTTHTWNFLTFPNFWLRKPYELFPPKFSSHIFLPVNAPSALAITEEFFSSLFLTFWSKNAFCVLQKGISLKTNISITRHRFLVVFAFSGKKLQKKKYFYHD